MHHGYPHALREQLSLELIGYHMWTSICCLMLVVLSKQCSVNNCDQMLFNLIKIIKNKEFFTVTCWFFFLSTDEVSSPTDLQFYEISDKKIVLTWSGPGGDISGYRVTAVPVDESGAPQKEVTLPVIQNSYVEVSHLEPGTLYRFNIYSIHDGEESLPLVGEQTTSEYDGWQCD